MVQNSATTMVSVNQALFIHVQQYGLFTLDESEYIYIEIKGILKRHRFQIRSETIHCLIYIEQWQHF